MKTFLVTCPKRPSQQLLLFLKPGILTLGLLCPAFPGRSTSSPILTQLLHPFLSFCSFCRTLSLHTSHLDACSHLLTSGAPLPAPLTLPCRLIFLRTADTSSISYAKASGDSCISSFKNRFIGLIYKGPCSMAFTNLALSPTRLPSMHTCSLDQALPQAVPHTCPVLSFVPLALVLAKSEPYLESTSRLMLSLILCSFHPYCLLSF